MITLCSSFSLYMASWTSVHLIACLMLFVGLGSLYFSFTASSYDETRPRDVSQLSSPPPPPIIAKIVPVETQKKLPVACVRATTLAYIDDEGGGSSSLRTLHRTARLCPLIGPDNCTRAGPATCIPHAQVFHPYLSHQWTGMFDPRYVRDFLGIRTLYAYDCANFRYRPNHLERQVPCNEHDAYTRMPDIKTYSGAFPIATEEYWEWLDCLGAVNDAVYAWRPLVVIELGARYGTWIARAAAAYRILYPKGAMTLIGVEADGIGFEWMKAHLMLNDMMDDSTTLLMHAAITERDGDVVDMAWEGAPNRVHTISLTTLLANYSMIDLIDMDIQGPADGPSFFSLFMWGVGAELNACRAPGAMEIMDQRVRRVHVGTHSWEIHRALVTLFTEHQWDVLYEHMGRHNSELWQNLEETIYGRMHFNDGVASFINTRFIR